jgi:hypothetical protein
MVQITIEYMILTPVFILLIFLLPLFASSVMNNYVDSRQNLELQNVANHLGSTIQQVYFSLNHETVGAGTISSNMQIPPLLEGYTYTVNATSRIASGSGPIIVDFKLILMGSGATTNASVTLDKNAVWVNSYFWSNSATASISAIKFSNNTIQVSIKP